MSDKQCTKYKFARLWVNKSDVIVIVKKQRGLIIYMSKEYDNYYNLMERIEDSFPEIDSDICTDLRDNDREYANMWQEIIKMQKAFPVTAKIFDGGDIVSLSAEECKALVRYIGLKHSMENLERRQIYFCGHTDNYAYLKKIGAI
jgi:hypothetical protein